VSVLDSLERLVSYEVAGLDSVAFAYDGQGLLAEASQGARTWSFDYDVSGRLEAATDPLSRADSLYYDLADRVRKQVLAGGDSIVYGYDASGSLTSLAPPGRPEHTLVGLPGGTLVEYTIDGRNRRIGRSVDGDLVQGLLYGDQLNPVAELDSLGNVVVNASTGAVAQRVSYDAWGRALEDTNPGLQPFGFAGGIWDGATGLVRFGARDYDAVAGRWTAKDPVGFGGSGENLYGYALGDPVNYIDILGLDPCMVQTSAGEIIVDQSIAERAASFVNSAVEYGWNGRITEHFRTSEQQQALVDNPPPGTPVVGQPGASAHEAGFALDLEFNSVSPAAQEALRRAAGECGFRQSIAGELWHFFGGEYGPYGDRASAIENNQRVVRDFGGTANLPTCSL
jgi:RHS repeat-associated protein